MVWMILILLIMFLLSLKLTIVINNLFFLGMVQAGGEMLFSLFVTIITMAVFSYSYYYMNGDINLNRFLFVVMLFYMSMMILINSSGLFTLFVGWDGLGVTSYWLVMYYQNWKSTNSGMVTVMSNRVGDFMLMFIIMLMMETAEWSVLMIIFLMLISLTKSAQWPFSSWLPLAMSAPTPVSALVHSSTLVTAGMILLYRFYELITPWYLPITLFCGLITIIISSLMGSVEMDFKKIIALSTLSQVSLMIISLSLDIKYISFFHLCTHAFFKSSMFLVAGVLIHSMWSQQYIKVYNMNYTLFTQPSFMFSITSLCGLIFMSGFYSKDLILESMYNSEESTLMVVVFLVVMVFTTIYSLRMLMSICSYNSSKVEEVMIYSKSFIPVLILQMMSLAVGTTMMWGVKVVYINSMMKFYLVMMIMMGVLLFNNLKPLVSSVKMLSSMVLLNKITIIVSKMNSCVKYSVVKLFERSYLDMLLTTPTINMKFLTALVYMNMNKGSWSMFLFLIIIILLMAN